MNKTDYAFAAWFLALCTGSLTDHAGLLVTIMFASGSMLLFLWLLEKRDKIVIKDWLVSEAARKASNDQDQKEKA
jgi:hypothetical protein